MSDQPAPLRDLSLPGASISVLAVERESGDVLASASPDRALAPASNTKLVTAGLALERLAPDYRYETRVVGDAPVVAGVLDGDLVFVGTGTPDFDASDASTLATEIGRRLDRIAGDLLVDGSYFSGEKLGPGWTWGDKRHAYGATSSAVALARNQVTVTVSSSDDGEDTSVSVTPETPIVSVDSDVEVDPEATTDDLSVYTEPEHGVITLRGAIPPGVEAIERSAPVPRPAYHCGLALRSALAESGVTLEGEVRVLEDASTASVKSNATPAVSAAVRSAPVRSLVRDMNVPSDNFIAEQLARTIARATTGDGSWKAWEEIVRDHFDTLGVETVRIRDGSGLSRYNLVPARGIIAHLRWVDRRPWAADFFDSLPTPGEGTLSSRLADVPVAAKTGTITGTSALSGLISRESAPDVFFSVLQGGLTREGSDAARETQDAFVRWLAETP